MTDDVRNGITKSKHHYVDVDRLERSWVQFVIELIYIIFVVENMILYAYSDIQNKGIVYLNFVNLTEDLSCIAQTVHRLIFQVGWITWYWH